MPTDANKIVLAVMIVWYFLVRMHYQDIARHRLPHHPVQPRREQLLNLSTSLWIVPVLVFIFTPLIDPLRLPFSDVLQKTGAVITPAGILLFWWTHSTLGRNWSPYLQVNIRRNFVDRGPYRWIRHPMYLSVFITGVGITLLSANWLVGLVFLLPTALLALIRIPAEEALLRAAFGQAYLDYQARTGRFLPRIWRLHPLNQHQNHQNQ